MADVFEFLNEVCGTCVYFLETPQHTRENICRFWVPTATSYNSPAMELHVAIDRPACGQYKRHPGHLAVGTTLIDAAVDGPGVVIQ